MRWRTWNWWKIGFFVMLIVFEVTREIAVLASDPYPAVAFADVQRSPDGSYVTAEGRWERINAGEALVPTAVRIACWRDIGDCIVASEPHLDTGMMPPFLDRFPARFTATGVEFTDDASLCAIWFYRVDAVHEVTTGVRTLKPSNLPVCRMERRIESRLAGWSNADFDSWYYSHFIPIFRGMRAIGDLF